jgi:hypothetical protein
VRRDYSSSVARALRRPRRTPRLLVSGRTRSTSTSPCAATTRLRPHALYVDLAVHREYSSPLSRLQRSTSTTPCVRVPRHVTRLVTRLVAPLIVDYSGLVVDYFTSAAHPGASARRAARHAARRAAHRRPLRARRRLLHLCCASGCLGTSRGSSRSSSRRSSSTTPGSSSTTSPPPRVRVPRHVARLVVDYSASRRLVVDYFASAARPGASARRVARRVARRATRCRLLRLRRASGCLGTSRGPSRGFVVDYSVRRNFLLRPHWLYFSHAVHRDYLSRGNTGSTSSTPHTATTSSYGRIALTIHLD